MAGTMSRAELVADLRSSLNDTAHLFSPEDFVRMLTASLPDMAFKRPRTLLGQVVLQAGVSRYAVTEPGFMQLKTHLWGEDRRLPRFYEPGYPGALPGVTTEGDGQACTLVFDPAPSALHLAALGSNFRFWFLAEHELGEDSTTVPANGRALLLLRAQAEAMRELAMRNVGKPVQMRDGFSGMARNATPPALFEALMAAFKDAR